jgi:hypothetical protein
MDVHESERVVVLQELEAWHLPGNYPAEDAVGIGFHLFLHAPVIIITDGSLANTASISLAL